MTNEEWEELLNARFEELITAVKGLSLIDQDLDRLTCSYAAREVCGVKLDENNFHLTLLAMALDDRRGEGSMTLDEAVTHLNNLPLGLKIADLQRAEVLEDDPQLVEAVELQEEAEKSLEQLCDEYEDGLVEGKHSPEAVAYIMALEDLVSEMQGKSFTDSSRIGQLEAENAALRRYLKVEDGKEPVKPS